MPRAESYQDRMDGSCSSGWGPATSSDSLRLKCPGGLQGPTPGASSSTTSTADQPKEKVAVTSGDGIAPPQRPLFPPEAISLKWAQVQPIGAGLRNVGNTCFLNATLQCLSYTPPLSSYMLAQEHSRTCDDPVLCMMCTMQEHITEVFANSGKVIKPVGVLNDLRLTAEEFCRGNQEDAHEFLRHIVSAMQSSCLPGTELDLQTQETSFIHQVFGGCLRSRVECLNCKAVSDTFEPFMDVALEIQTAPCVTKALEQFVRPEQLGGENAYKCSECKQMVTASKRLTIHRGSNVLTVALKRFADFSGGKLTKDVKYPEYLDLRPFMSQSQGEPEIYALYAVLVHSGFSCDSGHYYCYIKASSGRWYRMDDSSVTVSDIRSVLSQQAYLLFYIKSTDMTGRGDCSRSSPNPAQSSPGPLLVPCVSKAAQQTSTGLTAPLASHTTKSALHGPANGSLRSSPPAARAPEGHHRQPRSKYRGDEDSSYRDRSPHDRRHRDWDSEPCQERSAHRPREHDSDRCAHHYHYHQHLKMRAYRHCERRRQDYSHREETHGHWRGRPEDQASRGESSPVAAHSHRADNSCTGRQSRKRRRDEMEEAEQDNGCPPKKRRRIVCSADAS